MIKTRMVLGLAVVACTMVASSASAFGAAYFPTTKHGAEKAFEAKQKTTHIFTINGDSIECVKAVFKGKSPPWTGSSKITVLPTSEECRFAGESVKWVNEGCEYEFVAPTGTYPRYTTNVSIVTNKAAQCHITMTLPVFGSCVLEMSSGASNNNLKLIAFEDMSNNLGLFVKAAAVGITFTATGSSCALLGISSGKEAKYTGEVETEAVAIK